MGCKIRAWGEAILPFSISSGRRKVSKALHNLAEADSKLGFALSKLARDSPDFWSFKGKISREMGHALFQYPAMMVPRMQRELIEAAIRNRPETKSVIDPFVGSGTTLTESMLRGLDFFGQDINPLAVLICRSKTGPFEIDGIKAALEKTLAASAMDNSDKAEADFRNLRKWFQESAIDGLSKLRRAILCQAKIHVRRFLWVALAETVRLTSNSRISTVKLHMREQEEMKNRNVDVLGTFERVARANIVDLATLASNLEKAGQLRNGTYRRSVQVVLGNSAEAILSSHDGYDILVTSPPYGDNTTTVTYGQHSYLPLQWIEHADVDPSMGTDYLTTTHEIDRRSLGGSRRLDKDKVAEMEKASASLKSTLKELSQKPRDRRARVASFASDLDSATSVILKVLKAGALMFWTIGNRKVGGVQVPTDRILAEFLLSKKAVPVTEISRMIPSKRMAVRNSTSSTIKSETVLVFRKAETDAE